MFKEEETKQCPPPAQDAFEAVGGIWVACLGFDQRSGLTFEAPEGGLSQASPSGGRHFMCLGVSQNYLQFGAIRHLRGQA